MKTIHLNMKQLMKAGAIVDIKDFHRKYSLDKRNNSYSMCPNTPFIINVEGKYVSLTKLVALDKEQGWLIEQYIKELRNPTNDRTPFLCFKWTK